MINLSESPNFVFQLVEEIGAEVTVALREILNPKPSQTAEEFCRLLSNLTLTATVRQILESSSELGPLAGWLSQLVDMFCLGAQFSSGARYDYLGSILANLSMASVAAIAFVERAVSSFVGCYLSRRIGGG